MSTSRIMQFLLRRLMRILKLPLVLYRFFVSFYFFKKSQSDRFKMNLKSLYPCLWDATEHTAFDRHYIYHTAWATRKLREINPLKHVDIS